MITMVEYAEDGSIRLFPVRQLVERKPALQCISHDATIREAVELMQREDYSQLPITRDGRLAGLVSEKKIVKDLYLGEGSILELPVSRYKEDCTPVSLDTDIFVVFKRLHEESSVIVVEDGRPVGIITDWDVTQFFHDASRAILRINAIETIMKERLESIPSIPSIPKPKDKGEDWVASFGEYRKHICEHWPTIKHLFDPKQLRLGGLFDRATKQVKCTRDRIAHLKGEISPVELEVVDWVDKWFTKPARLSAVERKEITSAVERCESSRQSQKGSVSQSLLLVVIAM